jgi:PEP-CTERM motif
MIRNPACRGVLCVFLITAGIYASPLCQPGTSGITCTVGTPAQTGNGNCDPFGCPAFFGLDTYQQVYSSSTLLNMMIGSITFFDTQVHNGGNPAGGNFTISLSYTNAQPGGLDLTNPNNNIGSDSEVFFTGSLPTLTTIGVGAREMTLTGGTSFDYNPADGNLLLTLTVTSAADGSPFLYLDQAGDMSQTSNAYFSTVLGQQVNGGNDVGGLVTAFSGQPLGSSVPEPGSIMLFVTGAGILALAWKRRQRA